MPATYDSIASTTLGVPSADITFSGIPATYTDLRIVVVGQVNDNTSSAYGISCQFNGDTATNYSRVVLAGNGVSAYSSNTTSTSAIALGGLPGTTTSTNRSSVIVDIFNYAGSTNKTLLSASNQELNTGGTDSQNRHIVALWRSTSAITSIKIYTPGYNLNTGTIATLFGILKA